MGLTAKILSGLGLGVALGVFLGEPAARLSFLGDVYIRLMQMSVLPYLVLSLVIGFGQLDARSARRLGVRALAMLGILWCLVVLAITSLSLTYPLARNASFFSQTLIEPSQPLALQDLYFNANPFHALANAVVPSVVLFSSLLGICLIAAPGKQRVLELARALNFAVERITRLVIQLTPVGVFAIAAVTAGTIDLQTLQRLEAYLVVFTVASALLTFGVLPLAICSVTPFRYREIFSASKDALLTAFLLNSAFVVLPMLTERAKKLIEAHDLQSDAAQSSTEVLVPVLFNFPNAGKLLSLLFIPFSAWFAGSRFAPADYLLLFGVGIPTYFAKAQVAIPYLMDLFSIPQDLFFLYQPTSIVTGKLDSMVAAMNLFAFALIGAGAMGGFLRLRARRAAVSSAIVAFVLLLCVAGTRLLLASSIDTTYRKDEAIRNMQTSRNESPAVLHRSTDDLEPIDGLPEDGLARVHARGSIRVGYTPDRLPFSFFNASDELVGFDIELAHALAADLGLKLEFVPVDWGRLHEQLNAGIIDVQPNTWFLPQRFELIRYSDPYLMSTMGFVVKDEERHRFSRIELLRRQGHLRLGIPVERSLIPARLQNYFGDADVEFVELTGGLSLLDRPDLDAMLVPAETGSAWTLLHPEYTVVVPQPTPIRIPTGFAVAMRDESLVRILDEWIIFAQNSAILDNAYQYWVLGKGAESTRPRWSVLRDVLHFEPDR